MSFNTSNYGAARGILGFSELVLWCGVGLGIIVAIVAGGAASRGFGSSGLLAAVPGISMSIFCFVGVVLVQMAKATVDTADYSYQMLSVARDQLAVSKQGLAKASAPPTYAGNGTQPNASERPASSAAQSVSAAQSMPRGAEPSQEERSELPSFMRLERAQSQRDWDYRGKRINKTIHGYLFEGQAFESLELAKLHIDGEALRAGLVSPSRASS